MRGRRGTVVLGAALLGALAATACGVFGGGSNGDDATPEPSAAAQPATPPEEVLRLFVERRLFTGFVADCDDSARPDDVGKQCARRVAERNGLLAYELGPTFSEYTRLIVLRPAGDTWTIEHLEERDASAPPRPGIPWPIEAGAALVIAGTEPDCLRVRERPGLQAPEVTCLDDGTVVTAIGAPVEIDGFEWWQLEAYGWAASNWLRYPDEAGVATLPPEE